MMMYVAPSGLHGLRCRLSALGDIYSLIVTSDVLLYIAGSQQRSGLCYSLGMSWVLLLEDLQSYSAMLSGCILLVLLVLLRQTA